jgi:iron complex transport system substrate-binding protein
MRRITFCLVIIVLIVSAVPMAVMPASAQTLIPGDTEPFDKIISEEELASVILPYMLGQSGHRELEEVREIAHIHVYYPRTITDYVGREVTIYKPIERLVCSLSHHLEALRILKVSEDTIVGVPSDLDLVFFPEFGDVADVGGEGPWNPNVETILAQNPEVVILPSCGGPYGYTADEETKLLENAGVTVLRFCFNQPEDFSDELENCGYAFEKEEEAEAFIDWHDDILSSIEEKLSGADTKKVYAEHRPYEISESDDDIIAAAGGEDIFEGIGGAADVETLANEEPDIVIRAVFMGETGYALTPTPGVMGRLEGVRSEILTRGERDGWINETAENNECVYLISSQLWTYLPASGCRPFVGQCYLVKWFHPELFSDAELDPKEIHQEYLTRFQGLDIDLDEQGVFVYHPENHPDGN